MRGRGLRPPRLGRRPGCPTGCTRHGSIKTLPTPSMPKCSRLIAQRRSGKRSWPHHGARFWTGCWDGRPRARVRKPSSVRLPPFMLTSLPPNVPHRAPWATWRGWKRPRLPTAGASWARWKPSAAAPWRHWQKSSWRGGWYRYSRPSPTAAPPSSHGPAGGWSGSGGAMGHGTRRREPFGACRSISGDTGLPARVGQAAARPCALECISSPSPMLDMHSSMPMVRNLFWVLPYRHGLERRQA